MLDTIDAPALVGVHHLKVPVRDLKRSRDWYASRLGYEATTEFVEDGKLMGVGLSQPNGGPELPLTAIGNGSGTRIMVSEINLVVNPTLAGGQKPWLYRVDAD
ncbi:MAG TPA: VOC family protein [Acidimicrobiales bacterium]|nr:VOC family protein [Acidimicrobiales bacterium]